MQFAHGILYVTTSHKFYSRQNYFCFENWRGTTRLMYVILLKLEGCEFWYKENEHWHDLELAIFAHSLHNLRNKRMQNSRWPLNTWLSYYTNVSADVDMIYMWIHGINKTTSTMMLKKTLHVGYQNMSCKSTSIDIWWISQDEKILCIWVINWVSAN